MRLSRLILTPSLTLHLYPVSFSCQSKCSSNIPIDKVWSRLSDRVLQRSCDSEGCAYTQAKPKNTAVQLPETVLEPISAAQSLDSSPSGRHRSLVREQSIDDECVECDDDCWATNDDDA